MKFFKPKDESVLFPVLRNRSEYWWFSQLWAGHWHGKFFKTNRRLYWNIGKIMSIPYYVVGALNEAVFGKQA